MTCDLRDEPVLRVVRNQHRDPRNSGATVGFRDLLVQAHEIADLAIPNPAATAYLLRVLYTLAARITGIDKARNQIEFDQLRADAADLGRFDPTAVQGYLDSDEQADRWRLFDSTWPWLQDPRLVDQAERKNINALVATRPGQNSPIWWQHTWDGRAPALDPEQALYWLLAQHGFGSGGAGGVRRVNGAGDQYMSAGPLRGTITFYPLGDNLFETLLAGIPGPATATGTGPDRAPWELTELPDPQSQPPEATWPAGVLLGQSRHAILLVPDTDQRNAEHCYFTWAYKKRHPPLADPFAVQELDAQGGLRPRAADATRAVWRDIDALLKDAGTAKQPKAIAGMARLPNGWGSRFRVRALGWDQDRKATDKMMFTATTPPLVQWMQANDPDAAECAELLHLAAEEMAKALRSALRVAYRSLGTGTAGKPQDKEKDVPWIAAASNYYWPRAEDVFWRLLEQRSAEWPHREFLPIALGAVDAATRPTAHQLPVAREAARARSALWRTANRANPTPNRTDDGQ